MSPAEIVNIVASLATVLGVWLALRGHRRDETHDVRTEAKEDAATAARVNVAIDMLTEMRSDVKLVPALVRDVAWLKETVTEESKRLTSHLHSDHRDLNGELSDVREKLASLHDCEEGERK